MDDTRFKMKAFLYYLLSLSILSSLSNVGLSTAISSPSESEPEPEPVSFYSLPGIHRTSYSQSGDINVGALVVTDSATAEACKQETRLLAKTVEQTEAVAFAVDYVNRSPHILPNVSLGFTIRGICGALGPILASSLLFVPPTSTTTRTPSSSSSNDTTSTDITTCDEVVNVNGTQQCSSSTQAEGSSSSSSPRWLGHDVIGVVTMGWSRMVVPISSLYAVAQLPLIGPTESNDEFSVKKDHPYFFRVSPPQKYLVRAILEFVYTHGWSYISVLYNDCSYSLTTVIDNVDAYGICIATTHQVSANSNFDDIVSDLLTYPRARVVIVFITSGFFKNILHSIRKYNARGHFIWIGANFFDSYSGIEVKERLAIDPGIGTFYFDAYSKGIPDFFSRLRNIDVYKTKNPWLKPVWESFFDCSVDKGTCKHGANILQSSRYRTFKGTALRVDAILTLAHAAHDLLSDRCPDARGEQARACITGELLRDYLKNVSFDGFVGHVKFDGNQDIEGKYVLKQIVYDYPHFLYLSNTTTSTEKRIFGKEIGIYDIPKSEFTYFKNELSWSQLNKHQRIVPYAPDSSLSIEIPEAVCSRPCLPGEYKIEKKVSCCWECRTCRDNERFINGNTSCEACPSFTWPDPASGFTKCTDLPLTYSTLPDTIPLVLTSLAFIALVVTVAISVTYVIYRNERVIKASSRELSFLQLVAIFLGYSTIILFQTVPSDFMCGLIFFLFCMSFAMLYCPLLAKASRIFRIFKSGAKNERPHFISPQSQLLFSAFLLTIQITLCVATYILFTPKAVKMQPVWTEKLVELSCDFTLPGLASFLGYNIVLVSVCSVFAFLTRSLPDNFNESKFISMCVSTTLLIWLAFIPTYFTASREFVRVFLLSVALFLNHSVALIFLFVPKTYAAIYMIGNEGRVSGKAA